MGVLPAGGPAGYNYVLERLYSLSWPASLGIQTCDSEGCGDIVTPTPKVEETRDLALVRRYSIDTITRPDSCNACEVGDAAHAPRREQRAQEVQVPEHHGLRRHRSLSMVTAQHDRHAAKGEKVGRARTACRSAYCARYVSVVASLESMSCVESVAAVKH